MSRLRRGKRSSQFVSYWTFFLRISLRSSGKVQSNASLLEANYISKLRCLSLSVDLAVFCVIVEGDEMLTGTRLIALKMLDHRADYL